MGKLIEMPKYGPHSFPLRRGLRGVLSEISNPNSSYHQILFIETGSNSFGSEKEFKKEIRKILKYRLRERGLDKKRRKKFVNDLIELGKRQGWVHVEKDGRTWISYEASIAK
ncbi:MAG: hypothetical protein Q7R94_02770 [bacterium]|nr:hypothetical protein [bacterium]